MPTAQKALTLVDALLAFQAEMPKVGKDKTADTGKYKYKYADLAAVSDAALPLLLKHQLLFTCKGRRTEDGAYELVGTLRHAPSGESEESALPLFGRTAQEIGGSITYDRRYLLGIMTGIVTDEDTDAVRGSNQRAAQPTKMEEAQTRVQEVYGRYVEGRPWSFAELMQRYESDYDRPIGQASPADLHAWADSMEAEMQQRGQQQAVDGAQRALGATPVEQGD